MFFHSCSSKGQTSVTRGHHKAATAALVRWLKMELQGLRSALPRVALTKWSWYSINFNLDFLNFPCQSNRMNRMYLSSPFIFRISYPLQRCSLVRSGAQWCPVECPVPSDQAAVLASKVSSIWMRSPISLYSSPMSASRFEKISPGLWTLVVFFEKISVFIE